MAASNTTSKPLSHPSSNTRALAAGIINSLIAGKGSLSSQLDRQQGHGDYALLQETCYGVCRWWYLLEALLNQLLEKPLKRKDGDLKALLLVGLYQLRELSLPDYAVINESVTASVQLHKPWAKGLVNGVLRNYQRRRESLERTLAAAPTPVIHAFPGWLAQALMNDWPEKSEPLLEHSNQRPPLTLRVNLARTSRDQVLERLRAQGIACAPGKYTATAIYLDKPLPVFQIPGFGEGLVSVQDEASQLVTGLMDLKAGQRVLDACAAPGGKTCHILESEQSLSELVALDVEPSRLSRIQENLERLQLQAHCQAADAAATSQWWDGRVFDRILIDAPCSGTGVIRRHPDIKLLRKPNDVDALCQTQLRLLQQLWPTLAAGGLLLYTTCSLLRRENEQTVATFLAACSDAKYEGIEADWGVQCHYGRQLLTGSKEGTDGFFYALIRKI